MTTISIHTQSQNMIDCIPEKSHYGIHQSVPNESNFKDLIQSNKASEKYLEIKQICLYDDACNQICQVPGVRFSAIINKKGRKVAGGFGPKITPLEKDQQMMEMLFMEIALDFSMRKDYDNSFGSVQAIVSYRNKVNIITIPCQDNLILLSVEPELDISKVIQITCQKITSKKALEGIIQ